MSEPAWLLVLGVGFALMAQPIRRKVLGDAIGVGGSDCPLSTRLACYEAAPTERPPPSSPRPALIVLGIGRLRRWAVRPCAHDRRQRYRSALALVFSLHGSPQVQSALAH